MCHRLGLAGRATRVEIIVAVFCFNCEIVVKCDCRCFSSIQNIVNKKYLGGTLNRLAVISKNVKCTDFGVSSDFAQIHTKRR